MVNLSNKTKADLEILAELLGIPTESGWGKKLAERLNFSTSRIYGWIRNNRISKKGLKEIEEIGYPLEKWYIDPKSDFEIRESIGLTDEVTVEIVHPPKWYRKALTRIFETDDKKTIMAMKMSIEACLQKIEERKLVEENRLKIARLEHQLNQALEQKTAASAHSGPERRTEPSLVYPGPERRAGAQKGGGGS